MPIDLRPNEVAAVLAILGRHVPGREVRVFGSRVCGKAKHFSDLDLTVMGEEPVSAAVLADLREAFRESDLPFRVDVVDWATTRESFRRVIERESVVLRHRCGRCGQIAQWVRFGLRPGDPSKLCRKQ